MFYMLASMYECVLVWSANHCSPSGVSSSHLASLQVFDEVSMFPSACMECTWFNAASHKPYPQPCIISLYAEENTPPQIVLQLLKTEDSQPAKE